MRIRVAGLRTLDDVERELDVALRDLRALDASTNIMAKSSIEYRISALRRRKAALEQVTA